MMRKSSQLNISVYFEFISISRNVIPIFIIGLLLGLFEFIGIASIASLITSNSTVVVDISSSKALIWITFGSLVISAILTRFMKSRVAQQNLSVEYSQRKLLVQKLSECEWSRISSISQGQLISDLVSCPTMISNGAASFLNLIGSLAGILPIIVVSIFYSPFFVVIYLGIVLLGYFLVNPIRKRAQHSERLIQTQSALIGDQASYMLGTLKSIFASNRRDEWRNDLNEQISELKNYRERQLNFPIESKFNLDVLAAFLLVGVVLFLSLINVGSDVKLILLGLLIRLLPRIQGVQADLVTSKVQVTWVEHWKEILGFLESNQRSKGDIANVSYSPGTLIIQNLEVQHPSSNFHLKLDEIVFPKGSLIRVTGPSGSGKTSIIDGILGLIPMKAGSVILDNALVDVWNPAHLGKVSYLSQNGMLSTGSLRRILDPDSIHSDSAIGQVLEAVDLGTSIAKSPKGLETHLINLWSNFSGGEKQRLAIARVLLDNPDFIVLDECMTGVEIELELGILKLFKDYCERTGAKLVYISHRNSYPDSLFHSETQIL